MQELKPVTWRTQDTQSGSSAITYNPEIAEGWKFVGWPVDAFYALPDTHRIVPVELLVAAQSVMDTEGFDKEAEELQAIIGKTGQ
jgi:hypothetical protein